MFETLPPIPNETPALNRRNLVAVYSITPKSELLRKAQTSAEENWTLCSGCTECCEYISLEIDAPTTLKDVDNIIWYLIHQNVWVWVDEEDKWYVQFNTPCKKLDDAGRCGWYAHRPKLCQDYKQAECPRYTDGAAEKFLFKDEEQFMNWLALSRSVKLRSLHQRYLVQRAQRWQRKSTK